jgi:FkbM family methyltransferase
MDTSSFVTFAVRLYRKSSVKPFKNILRNVYYLYLSFLPSKGVVRKEINGIFYDLDLREVIDSQMFYADSREPATSRALELLCRKGDCVVDIGANVGSHALPIAQLVGNKGFVFAFEPVPWAVRKLKKNISLNNFHNIKIEQIALSDENQDAVSMRFRASFRVAAGQGVDNLGKINQEWWEECEDVLTRLQTLDSYIDEHQIPRVNLIKLDVDGFEGKVIRGGLRLLERDHPILIMEIAPAWLEMRGERAENLLGLLQDIGYKCYSELNFKKFNNLNQIIQCIPAGGGVNVILSTFDLPKLEHY